MTYQLNEKELKAVANLKEELKQVQENLQRIQGAFAGMAQLLGQQQDLLTSNSNSIQFNAEITALVVTKADTPAA